MSSVRYPLRVTTLVHHHQYKVKPIRQGYPPIYSYGWYNNILHYNRSAVGPAVSPLISYKLMFLMTTSCHEPITVVISLVGEISPWCTSWTVIGTVTCCGPTSRNIIGRGIFVNCSPGAVCRHHCRSSLNRWCPSQRWHIDASINILMLAQIYQC